MPTNISNPGTTVTCLVRIVDAAGEAVIGVINTTTTRLEGYPTSVPTIETISTGNYRIVFSGLNPAVAGGDTQYCKINGTADGDVFSEWVEVIQIIEMTDKAQNSLDAILKVGEAATYTSALGSQSVTFTRD